MRGVCLLLKMGLEHQSLSFLRTHYSHWRRMDRYEHLGISVHGSELNLREGGRKTDIHSLLPSKLSIAIKQFSTPQQKGKLCVPYNKHGFICRGDFYMAYSLFVTPW